MLPLIALLLLRKNLDQRADQSMKYHKRIFCHVQNRARQNQKRKTSHCAKPKCFTEKASAFVGEFRSNGPKVLLALRSRGGFITLVIAVSVAKVLIARNSHLMLDHIDMVSSSWAKSLFRRMGFKKRMKTTGKIVEQRKRPNFCIYMILCLWLMTIIFLIV